MLTYFEIAYKMVEKEEADYCLPQDACEEAGFKEYEYAPTVYEYTLNEEYLFASNSSYQENKDTNILFMLLCAAAENESFPIDF